MIVLASALMAWWTREISWTPVIILLVLAVLGEIWEFIASASGAKKAGGSGRGAVVSIIGGVVGAIAGTPLIPVPIVGTIVGECVGAGLGAYLGDRWAGRTHGQATAAGQGAAVGRFWGTIGKVGIALVMWLVATIATVWGAAT